MTGRGARLAALSLGLMAVPRPAVSEDLLCRGVDACVRQLVAESVRKTDSGITGRERELAGQLVELGAPAVQALIPLLDSRDPRTAGSAAHALSRFGPAARPALAALGRSLVRGNGWAGFALADTEDPAAIPLLVAGAVAGQETAARALMSMGPPGRRAAAEMLAKGSNVEPIAQEFLNGVRFAEGDRASFVAPLVEVAKSERVPRANRLLACEALGLLGDAAVAARPVLRVLSGGRDAELAEAATQALIGIGDPARAPGLLARLETAKGNEAVVIAFELSRLGVDASGAAPAVIAAAEAAAWDRRALYVGPLGVIGGDRAVSFLAGELESPDWRVVMAAVGALGQLGGAARAAAPALGRTARGHWLPRLRQYAAEVRAAIEAGRSWTVVAKGKDPDVPLARWAASRPVEGVCRGVQDAGWKFEGDLVTKKRPRGLAHLDPRGSIVTHAVDGGLLVGTNRGEWGGEVVWVHDGREEKVAEANVVAIVARPWGLVLLQGLSHMGLNYGTVSLLSLGADGRWTARPFLELPAVPYGLRELPDGGLGIATRGGVVTLDGKGAVRRFDCDETRPPPPK